MIYIQVHRRYKCGVLYIKDGQTKEEEWLANTDDSEAFDRFLDILGHKVELHGYTGWAGGLDTKSMCTTIRLGTIWTDCVLF